MENDGEVILRSFTEHLKTQNWTAVTLDFFIVVLGVFIGIQVSNWNETQSKARIGARFTERLVSDMRVEAWRFQYVIEY